MGAIKFKHVLLFIGIIIISACRSRVALCGGLKANFITIPESNLAQTREHYRVLSIDSTNKLYYIYVMSNRDSSVYKVPSLRDSSACSNIKVGSSYPFILFSMTAPIALNGKNFSVREVPHINTVSFHGIPVTIEATNIKDVRMAVNVSGLCMH